MQERRPDRLEERERERPYGKAKDLSDAGLIEQKVYKGSLSGSGASPNAAVAAQFVRAEMLPSGYFIRPCKGGGSIIHKVDMLVWISCQAS
ncbi:hypothetical protein ACSBR2_026116 [Camellia fascicularis]